MIYLDYSSNHPVRKEVLDSIYQIESEYIGNINSTHPLGLLARKKYDEIYSHIMSLLSLNEDEYEIIFTSSATESNNLAIKGIYSSYYGTARKFVSSPFEHSSINATLSSLKDKGAEINITKVDERGKFNPSDYRECVSNTLLSCFLLSESETGVINDVHELQKITTQEKSHLLVDATQAIGKIPFTIDGLDMVTFSPHKFGGIIGTGVLIKKKDIILYPLIHGGKSISIYRASTPPLSLINSIDVALTCAFKDMEKNLVYVKSLYQLLFDAFKSDNRIFINSSGDNPYIFNFSIKNNKSNEILEYLNSRNICVSFKSACSLTNTPSKTINAIFHDKNRASSSIRVSLSYLTTLEEIKTFINVIGEFLDEKRK